MKRTVGIDLGPNSIGWASVLGDEVTTINEKGEEKKETKFMQIEKAGVRIIPMDGQELSNYDKGNLVSKASARTKSRSVRKLIFRHHQIRARLNVVLKILGYLPQHYSNAINIYGFFDKNEEPKLAWTTDAAGQPTFLFKDSFDEMVAEIHKLHPDVTRVPYDWTIYYLRNKALTQKISSYELSWILLQFNKKRGYSQLRSELADDAENEKIEEYMRLTVVNIEDTLETDKSKRHIYQVTFDNDLNYKYASYKEPDWIGQAKEIIVTTKLDKDSNPKHLKDGTIDYSIRLPQAEDWGLKKIKTEADIAKSGLTIGSFIYNALIHNLDQKINGALVQTVGRDLYDKELSMILDKQMEFHSELSNAELYTKCIETLYHSNDAFRNSIKDKGFKYLLKDNIVLYQRPLKSKKSTIADCKYEKKVYYGKDKKDVTKKPLRHVPLKCAPRSHPLFQEFRLWQFLSNLLIYKREAIVNGKVVEDLDITKELLTCNDDYVYLFDKLNDRKEVKQSDVLKIVLGLRQKKVTTADLKLYRWNFVEDKSYPCNTTRAAILSKLTADERASLTPELLLKIWHLLYSVTTQKEMIAVFAKGKEEKDGICKTLRNLFSPETIEKIKNLTLPEDDYCSYSVKAMKKLLPLMRRGSYWCENNIDESTMCRINKIIDGEEDSSISMRVRECFSEVLSSGGISMMQGLSLYKAEYLVYDLSGSNEKWETPEQIDTFIEKFKRNSLNNPTVERVIMETLRTVRDIWRTLGTIDEIHIEMARDVKQSSNERKSDTDRNSTNEDTNFRIKTLLYEYAKPEYGIDNVIPSSPLQQLKLKIVEECAIASKHKFNEKTGIWELEDKLPDSVTDMHKHIKNEKDRKKITSGDFKNYKLWLEQRYRSPYTGEMIPFAKLFTDEYQREHIIPKARYFDNSLSNQVICEAEVNRLKDDMLGLEFIHRCGNTRLKLSNGKTVKIFNEEEYTDFVKSNFTGQAALKKRKILLSDEIPASFTTRQLNDTRYITRLIKKLMSNIVRVKDNNGIYEQEETSKNVIICNGTATTLLKNDWGINDIWNSIILPRFKRLNENNDTDVYTALNNQGHLIPTMPLNQQKGFNKKRIDHRHHAMDAIVIACTTRSHVQLISNEHSGANESLRAALSHKLRRFEDTNTNGKVRPVAKEFIKPWESFTADANTALRDIIVSFKQNLKVISSTSNHYQRYVNGKKEYDSQLGNNHLSIRKPLHKETYLGLVNLRKIGYKKLADLYENPHSIIDKDLKQEVLNLKHTNVSIKDAIKYFKSNSEIWKDININKIECYYFTNDVNQFCYANRKSLGSLATVDDTKIDKKIDSITDTGIQKILRNYIRIKKEEVANDKDNSSDDKKKITPAELFSPDGIEDLNRDIAKYNNGKAHKPIYNIRVYEQCSSRYAVGTNGVRSRQFVEAAGDTNLYYLVYNIFSINKKTGEEMVKRSFATLPVNFIIDCQKTDINNWKTVAIEKAKAEGYITEDNIEFLFFLSPGDFIYLPDDNEDIKCASKIDKRKILKVVSFTSKRLYVTQYYFATTIVEDEYTSGHKYELTDDKQIMIPISVDRLGNIKTINGKSV